MIDVNKMCMWNMPSHSNHFETLTHFVLIMRAKNHNPSYENFDGTQSKKYC
jgi:hypothetical protein